MNRANVRSDIIKTITVYALQNVPDILLVKPKELFDGQISPSSRSGFLRHDNTSYPTASEIGVFLMFEDILTDAERLGFLRADNHSHSSHERRYLSMKAF